MGKIEVRQCENCGQDFLPKRQWQIFCSSKCRLYKWDKKNPRVKLQK